MKTEPSRTESANPGWSSAYQIGGAAALLAVLTGLVEILITFLPGGGMSGGAETVIDWFRLFHDNAFMGLRNLGLLNLVLTACAIPIFTSLYIAHRRMNEASAALAMIVAFMGVAVFFATNRAFPMLDLSRRYAIATTDAQRSVLEAAGQAMLSEGQSHTPGTFIGFFLIETAGIGISLVMLRSKVFGRASAYTGILGFSFLFIFEVCASFAPGLSLAMVFALGGGLLSMAWYVLVARRLFQLGQGISKEERQ